jgi:glyoxylase-like metal-dependent hydrolase (beta-lactamase superfamily II)
MTDIHRIEFETDWPPWHVAAYLLAGEDGETVLVDAGAPGDRGWGELTDGLAEAGLAVEDLDHLLVTHPHTDHDGLVERIVETADPTVYTPRSVQERLRMDTARLSTRVERNARAAGLSDDAVSKYVEQAVDSVERNRECFPPACVDVPLEPGQVFEAGDWEFEVVHTPGHQRDHACFAAERWLFAGDQVIEPFRAAALNVGLDDGVFDAISEFYEGYRRLRGREFETVYPGHGPVFDDFEGVVQQSVADLDDLVSEVSETLAELAPATCLDIEETRTEARYDYTLFETVGALGHLTDRGRAVFRVEDGVRYYEPAE